MLKENPSSSNNVLQILDGKTGTGKSLSLAHILHYGINAGFVLVHVPWGNFIICNICCNFLYLTS